MFIKTKTSFSFLKNILNLSGFDKKTQLQSCSPQKSMRFKKKVSKLLFSFKSYEHLYFRARPVNNIGLNLVIFIGIFISQRANISYLGKLSDFYCFFLFYRRYDWMKIKKHRFLSFFCFREALKKKRCEKMQFFRVFGLRFNFI